MVDARSAEARVELFGGGQARLELVESDDPDPYAILGEARLSTGQTSVDQAFKGSRPGTSRPMTSLGRQVRLDHEVVGVSSSRFNSRRRRGRGRHAPWWPETGWH